MGRFDGDTTLNFFKQFIVRKREFQQCFESNFTNNHESLQLASIPGASHFDDTFYFFKTDLNSPPPIDSLEFKLIKIMVDLITSFVISGTPATSTPWLPVRASDDPPMVLNIANSDVSFIPFPENDKIKAFNQIYSEFNVDIY
jgi:hypothetical protein